MRATCVLVLAAGVAMAGCATMPKPMATGPACPELPMQVWSPAIDKEKQKSFDAELQRRFGSTGTHILIDQATDAKGDIVVTGRRIGPAKFAMPETGKGGEVQAVFQACTHKLLRTRKLAELEADPKPWPKDEPET